MDETEYVTTSIGQSGGASAATYVLGSTKKTGTGPLDLCDSGLEVGYMNKCDRRIATFIVSLGDKCNLETSHVVPDVVGLVGVWFDAKKCSVDSLGCFKVIDGIHD